MKQILQHLGNGETQLAEVPCPRRSPGALLCETTTTLVSLGTEKMLIDFGKGGWISKARAQPDKVKQVLQKIKTDGLWATVDSVRAKLDAPIPLGYCHVGKVVEADTESRFAVGQRIVSNGPHAEMVSVPENLAARIPENVTDEQAAFTVVGAIGLQGIRLIQPTLGEKIVVSGLGLIGLLAVQMLRANGCQVLGIDFDKKKLELARQFGAETVDLSAGQDPIKIAEDWTHGVGVDGVLITASAKTDDIIHQAATMCRKRGRVVLVGVIGLNLRRSDFYEKEISFQVSCSYGPGRYEDNYEQKGMDYPIGFVRWTEQRNFQAVLGLMADGKLQVDSLITHRFPFDNAVEGYQAINESGALGILLQYEGSRNQKEKSKKLVELHDQPLSGQKGTMGIAFVGAGAFTTRMLLPLLPKEGVNRKTIVSSTGVSAAYAGKKHGFANIGSDTETVWKDKDVDAVFITTPHNSHAHLTCAALNAGKHVFVEKPLAMTHDELANVQSAVEKAKNRCLMIGFNRRFSPHSQTLKKWLAASPGSKSVVITVNAGAIPQEHWTQDPAKGGGRIIGEACHFIDLARFFVDRPIASATATAMSTNEGRLGDCVTMSMSFEDGSIATVHYLANGNKAFPKERIEIFNAGQVFVCDNFRSTKRYGGKGSFKTRSQDKGHAAELKAFVNSIQNGGAWPISLEEQIEVSRVTIDLADQIRQQIAASETD